MAPRETENNAYAKFWRDKQRTLWYVMVFLEWSIDFIVLLLFELLENMITCPSGKLRTEFTNPLAPAIEPGLEI